MDESTRTVDSDGTITYRNSAGQLHRVDGPAIEDANGDKEWYLNGQYHRIDGPAIEYADGDKFWCINDQLHCVDGPAAEDANGDKKYWYNGEGVPEKVFNLKNSKQKCRKTYKCQLWNPIGYPPYYKAW